MCYVKAFYIQYVFVIVFGMHLYQNQQETVHVDKAAVSCIICHSAIL